MHLYRRVLRFPQCVAEASVLLGFDAASVDNQDKKREMGESHSTY